MSEKELPPSNYIVEAPGRVNLLGEHVDYNDGPVLPVAIDRSNRIAFDPLEGSIVELHALDMDQSVRLDLNHLDAHLDADGQKLPGWAAYPAGVAWALQQEGLAVRGMHAAFTSTIPMGSGLSSSAALEVGFAFAWQTLGGWSLDRLSLARLCQKAENQYVGVKCGLMDQFASACGVAGHALFLNTRTLEYGHMPLPTGTAIVVANSMVRHSLSGSEYNERRAACEKAVSLLKASLPGIRALRDVTPDQFNELSGLLPAEIGKRARHVVEECARVDQAIVYLAEGKAVEFGQLMFAGHASLRDLYEVSVPELDALVELAAGLPGCLGARLTGAGFGGCTVNLVKEQNAPAFIDGLKAGYFARTGKNAQIYLCHASAGVHLR
ncbi:MAG TPA: galactokinase [Anaerolineaceae bacterium]|nr:galactokinase [Anaerolineaceae bacterium]HPN52466.1 galactokinase [Anaerolineaceae bacterium]